MQKSFSLASSFSFIIIIIILLVYGGSLYFKWFSFMFSEIYCIVFGWYLLCSYTKQTPDNGIAAILKLSGFERFLINLA